LLIGCDRISLLELDNALYPIVAIKIKVDENITKLISKLYFIRELTSHMEFGFAHISAVSRLK
jgi:hypothetical protein